MFQRIAVAFAALILLTPVARAEEKMPGAAPGVETETEDTYAPVDARRPTALSRAGLLGLPGRAAGTGDQRPHRGHCGGPLGVARLAEGYRRGGTFADRCRRPLGNVRLRLSGNCRGRLAAEAGRGDAKSDRGGYPRLSSGSRSARTAASHRLCARRHPGGGPAVSRTAQRAPLARREPRATSQGKDRKTGDSRAPARSGEAAVDGAAGPVHGALRRVGIRARVSVAGPGARPLSLDAAARTAVDRDIRGSAAHDGARLPWDGPRSRVPGRPVLCRALPAQADRALLPGRRAWRDHDCELRAGMGNADLQDRAPARCHSGAGRGLSLHSRLGLGTPSRDCRYFLA